MAVAINQNWGEFSPILAWVSRGLAQERKIQYPEALASFEAALKLEPQNSLALASSCRVMWQSGQYKQAIASCDRALQVNKNWADSSPAQAWFWRGIALSSWGKSDQILASCPQTETNSELAITLRNECIKKTRQFRLEGAISSFEQAVAIEPKFAAAWNYQGIALSQLNRYIQGVNALQTALKINPNNALTLVSLCSIFNKLRNYQAALIACEGALQGDENWAQSDPADALIQQGQALAGLKRYEEAIASIDRSLSLKPNSAIAHNAKSVILWQAEKYQEALQSNDRALANDPNYFQAWFNRGMILRGMQHNQAAIAAYERALQSDVSLVSAAALASTWANRSAVLWDLGQYQEAIASANSAIAIDPNSVSAWFNRGLSLASIKEYEQAVNSYQRALDIEPKQVNILVAQGMAFFQLKRYPEALNSFEAALKIDPNYLPAKQNRDLLNKAI